MPILQCTILVVSQRNSATKGTKEMSLTQYVSAFPCENERISKDSLSVVLEKVLIVLVISEKSQFNIVLIKGGGKEGGKEGRKKWRGKGKEMY